MGGIAGGAAGDSTGGARCIPSVSTESSKVRRGFSSDAVGVERPSRFAPALPKAANAKAPPPAMPAVVGAGRGGTPPSSVAAGRSFFRLLPPSELDAAPLGGALELERVFLFAIMGTAASLDIPRRRTKHLGQKLFDLVMMGHAPIVDFLTNCCHRDEFVTCPRSLIDVVAALRGPNGISRHFLAANQMSY